MKSPCHDLFDHWSYKKNNLMWIYNHFKNKKFCLPGFIFTVKLFKPHQKMFNRHLN